MKKSIIGRHYGKRVVLEDLHSKQLILEGRLKEAGVEDKEDAYILLKTNIFRREEPRRLNYQDLTSLAININDLNHG